MDIVADPDDRQYVSEQEKARKWAKKFCLWTYSKTALRKAEDAQFSRRSTASQFQNYGIELKRNK